jgi:Zn-dependent peptidase ImmA (M78 family)/transcriptional regulator with XRE-family HTH domain
MPSTIKAYINTEVLRWARESINMEPAEAAQRIGTSRDRLMDWEEGIEVPSIHQMRKASEVYKRPLAAFYLPSPPRDFRVPENDFRRLPDAALNSYPPELLLELRRMQYQREIAVMLSEASDSPIRELIGSVNGHEPASDVAESIRKLLGITVAQQTGWRDEYDALNAWKKAIEKLGVLVFHFEGVPLSAARGISEASYPFPIIGVNGKDTPQARIFTLLHEFGHLLLSESGVCDTRERKRKQRPQDEVETYCNRIAGITILPGPALLAHPVAARHGASTTWKLAELRAIAEHFRVSIEVVARRLVSVGKMSREHYLEHRAALAAVAKKRKGGPLPVPRRVLRRIGQPYARIVIDAYNEERITGSDVAEFLGTRLKWLSQIEDLLAGRNVLTGGDR